MGEMTDTLREHKLDIDQSIAMVMPDTWVGHARIILLASDLSNEDVEQAKAIVNKLLGEKTNDPEKAAKAAVQALQG